MAKTVSGELRRWPGSDDKLVVAEMLRDPASPHWRECRTFIERIIQESNLPADLKEETVQNTMLSVIKSLPNFRYECRFTTWLAKISHVRKIDALRAYTRDNHRLAFPDDPSEETENETDIFQIYARQTIEDECVIRETLQEALIGIRGYIKSHAKPDRNRLILQKVLFEGYSTEDVAQILGIPVPVVSYVVRGAQHFLREKMEN